MRASPGRVIHVVTAVASVDDACYYKVQRLVSGPRGRSTLDIDVRVLHINELAQAIGEGGLFYVMRRDERRPRAALFRLALRSTIAGRWTLEVSALNGAADAIAMLPRFPFVREAHADDISGLQALACPSGERDEDATTDAHHRLIHHGWAARGATGTRLTAVGNAILARF